MLHSSLFAENSVRSEQLEVADVLEPDAIPIVRPDGTLRSLKEIQAAAIEHALILTGGNRVEAAKALGIGRSTLYRKLEELAF